LHEPECSTEPCSPGLGIIGVAEFGQHEISHGGEILAFQPGVGMLGSRLNVPVVPVRLRGLDRVLHPTWRMARPGRATVAFGLPLRLHGQDYATAVAAAAS
jgi:long-chain acyl-CoA synthetase